ncbi:MAG: CDC48 family AAA ATPase [Archaeoglobaceae archaeon]
MNEDNKMSLRVKEAYHRDVGRGIARTDPEVIDQMGLKSGDIIEITGKGKVSVPGIVWPGYPEDRGSGVIRIDGNLRTNAGVGIDDKVTIKKSSGKDAEKITFAPTEPVRLMGGENYLQRLLEGRPIKRGQKIRVEVFGHALAFQVTSTKPSGIVRVTKNSDIELKEKPVEEVERAVPDISYEDIGGLKREVRLVREMIELPLKHPELFQRLGIDPPKGVLLQGPPGTGKTLIAKAVANEVDAHYISLSGPEIMSKYYGESEQKLREIFDEAKENTPAVIFIDEIDSIAPKREEVSGEVERRVVAQLLSLMDGLEARGDVVVIAATNRVDALDPALRRPGRFDREIEIGVPDSEGRKEILDIHTRGMPLAEGVDIHKFADLTLGFVGADLEALAKEGAMHALRRVIPEIDIDQEELSEEALDSLEVTEEDFLEAKKNVEPSAMREVLVEVPNIRWTDVGGLDKAKQEMQESVEWPVRYPEVFSTVHVHPSKGIMLYGPPGTGKTLIAKAVANESNANFISVKGPELISKWVGESEKHVREMFRKARQVAPTVLFFDELDSLAPKRGGYGDSHVSERVVSQLLTELDGLEELNDVIVVTATNRPDMVDPALLRPGRIERHIYIQPPSMDERRQIFEIHLQGKPYDLDLQELAEKSEGYTGADIEAVSRESAMLAIRENIKPDMTREEAKEIAPQIKIEMRHIEEAMNKIKPSFTKEDIKKYEEMVEGSQRMYA